MCHEFWEVLAWILIYIPNIHSERNTMNNLVNEPLIIAKIQQISSEHLKQELMLFLDELLDKQLSKRTPRFGCAKGTFKMSADFDEPLADFKDYIPLNV